MSPCLLLFFLQITPNVDTFQFMLSAFMTAGDPLGGIEVCSTPHALSISVSCLSLALRRSVWPFHTLATWARLFFRVALLAAS